MPSYLAWCCASRLAPPSFGSALPTSRFFDPGTGIPTFEAMNPFRAFFRPEAQWTSVGLTSAFPDIEPESGVIARSRLCGTAVVPGCKVFHIPKTDPTRAAEVPLPGDDRDLPEDSNSGDLSDQVLVFQYRGKFHAIDHVSPVAPPRV